MKLFRKLQPGFVRGLVCLSVLLGICAMLFPLPIASLPQNSAEKDSSEPFPCQNRPCGCRSAEQCWKKCCCFNNAQKVAWAKANKVTVPNYVLAAAKNESRTSVILRAVRFDVFVSGKTLAAGAERMHNPRLAPRGSLNNTSLSPGRAEYNVSSNSGSNKGSALTQQRNGCSHCEQKPIVEIKTSCCDKLKTQAVAEPHSCESCTSPVQKSPEFHKKPASSKWVLAVCAAECQGQGPPAFCFPISIIPDRLRLVAPSNDVVETFVFKSERLQQASLRPPLPPPKIV